MKNKIYSRFDRPVAVAQTFTEFEKTYDLVTDPVKGIDEVKQVGETNIYNKIQEAAFGLEIQQIVEKYANGEIKPGEIDPANYADISGMPKSMLEAHMRVNALRSNFEKMDLQFRQKYDFDFGKYIATLNADGTATNFTYTLLEENQKAVKAAVRAAKKAAAKQNAEIAAEIAAEAEKDK